MDRAGALHLPLQAGDNGQPRPLQDRDQSRPEATQAFVCAPLFEDAAAAWRRMRRQFEPGCCRLLVTIRCHHARTVNAVEVPCLDEARVLNGDRTAHALLERLGRAGVDMVDVRGVSAPVTTIFFTAAVGRTIEVVSAQQVEVRPRDRVWRRRRVLGDAAAAATWAAIFALLVPILGVDRTLARLREQVVVDLGTTVQVPLWAIVAAAFALASALVIAVRAHRRRIAARPPRIERLRPA